MTSERPRGILAPVDREFLSGEKEYSHRQSTYKRKETIHERIRNALLDFTILFRHLDEEQCEGIFNEIDDDEELRQGVTHALAFLFDGTATPSVGSNVSFDDEAASKQLTDAGLFDRVLEEAYVLALFEYHFVVDEFEPPTVTGEHIEGIRAAREMAEAGEWISPRYIQMLLNSDVIESGPIQEAVRERLLEDVPPQLDTDTDGDE